MRTGLAVPDISCESCKTTIDGASKPLTGVEAIEIDIAGRGVDVMHHSALDSGRIVASVRDQGYEVAARDEVA